MWCAQKVSFMFILNRSFNFYTKLEIIGLDMIGLEVIGLEVIGLDMIGLEMIGL